MSSASRKGSIIVNNRGRITGLALLLMLIIALIVAYLVTSEMGLLRVGGAKSASPQERSAVEHTLDVVDQFNAAKQKTLGMLENPGGEG